MYLKLEIEKIIPDNIFVTIMSVLKVYCFGLSKNSEY